MSEVSSDGVLALHPNIKDTLSLAVPINSVTPDIVEYVGEYYDLPKDAKPAGRSAAGQLGLDLVRIVGTTVVYKSDIHVPVSIDAFTETAKAFEEDINQIRTDTRQGEKLLWKEDDIRFGRMVDYSKLRRLEKDEVERAIASRLIGFDPAPNNDKPYSSYVVNEDGSVSLPLSLLSFVFNPKLLSRPEQRFNALYHGRAGLIPMVDTKLKNGEEDIPDFMVGGTVFSPGPFYVKIREQISKDGKIRQLGSAALFDGNRLMGTNPRYDDYTRNRQVEIFNTGSSQNIGDTTVTIDILRPEFSASTLHPVVNWWNMSTEQKMKTHLNGISPLDVIKAEDPASREELLNGVRGRDRTAIVMSAHGISKVDKGETPYFTAQNISEGARSFGRYREIPIDLKHLEPFVNALYPAADRSRLVVADELELKHIPNIVKSGDIRAILMRKFLGMGAKSVAISKEDHSAIVDLVREGVQIAWDNEGDLREMHRSGLWLTPEGADRIESLDLVIAMYGSHIESVTSTMEPKIKKFFEGLKEVVPAENLGVVHGNMAGIMGIADKMARNLGIMSLGVGLDLSSVGQEEVNMQADGFLILGGNERLYRQEKLDKFNTVSIFNVGGYGTLEELFITLCSQKLTSRLPGPNILISPNDLFDDAKKLTEKIANENLGQMWVSKTLELVDSYDRATEIVKGFWKDPGAYWRSKGLLAKDIAIALKNHEEVLDQMGMRLAPRLKLVAESYYESFQIN
jgi:predicted Rossmann-fold nucleotide-binding protein